MDGTQSEPRVSAFVRSIIGRHGEPGPARRQEFAVVQERLQRRGELQGELPELHSRAGRGPLRQAAGQDAQEDGVRRPLVLAGVLPSPHSQWSCQPHLKARLESLGSTLTCFSGGCQPSWD